MRPLCLSALKQHDGILSKGQGRTVVSALKPLRCMKVVIMDQVCKPEETHVVVLAGGKSGEREVSLASGQGVEAALIEAGFRVTTLDPANRSDLIALVEGSYDVAFLALHGKYGEDGTIQGMLEILGIPYTGPGVWSSATAIDKPKAKGFYEQFGIPTPRSLILNSASVDVDRIISEVGNHCVVKAATEGSALGVYLCEGPHEVEEALKQVFDIDSRALVETYIDGDEYTVAVLGNEDAYALPVIKIIPSNEFYDYESKYAAGGSQHLCPAPLSDEDTERAQSLAVAAHRALECRGVSRTDLIQDASGQFWVLETNTIPGMTSTSLLPDAARAAGMTFPELCAKMVQDALV